jgi:ABC-type branched-subunit amino acid transport system ATPase component
MTAPGSPAILSCAGLVRSFGALRAVDGVELTLPVGARHALIGPNGAGKSTLFQLLAGGLVPTAGRVWLAGRDVTRVSDAGRARLGIGQTFQHSSLFPSMTAAQNVTLAAERVHGRPWSPWPRPRPALRERVVQLLADVELADRRGVPVAALSHGECRQLELAVALATAPCVLLLDEPAAGMSPAESERFAALVHRLPAELAILFVEHDLDLVFRLATRVTVLHLGKVLLSGAPEEVRQSPAVQEAYLGTGRREDLFLADPDEAGPFRRSARRPRGAAVTATTGALEVHGLRSGYRQGTVLHGVDLAVARGGILALLGRNGVGKTTLVMTIMGLVRPSRGQVQLDGRDLAGRRPDEIARAGIALVPQGRRIWPALTVHEHLELAGRHARRTGRARSPDELYQQLPRLAERRRQLAGQMSGGEQQMLAIARALVTGPSVVLLDEPSEGLAPRVVDQIGEMIAAIAGGGVAVLLVEQDLHLAFGVADQIAVMAKGAIVHRSDTAAFRRDPATARRLLGIEA